MHFGFLIHTEAGVYILPALLKMSVLPSVGVTKDVSPPNRPLFGSVGRAKNFKGFSHLDFGYCSSGRCWGGVGICTSRAELSW